VGKGEIRENGEIRDIRENNEREIRYIKEITSYYK